MWPFLQAFLGSSASYFLRAVVIKFVMFTAIAALVLAVVPYIAEKINSFAISNLGNDFVSLLPSGAIWFFALFRFDIGLPMIFSAMFVRFAIRRIPGIG